MNTRFITDVLYEFKKDYGADINYIVIQRSDLDYATGQRELSRLHFKVKAVILPQTLTRKFIQDIGYLAANKNFTYGGMNDFNVLNVIFLKRDIPSNLNVDLDGYIVYQNERYSKVSILQLADVAYVLQLKRVEGDRPYDILARKIVDEVIYQEVYSNELN